MIPIRFTEPKWKKIALFVAATLIILGYVILIAGCNGEKSESFKHSPSDTILTFLAYRNNGVKWDIGYKIRKDSLDFVDTDSLTKKRKWSRSSLYFIPFVDTLRDAIGKPQLDSIGKPKTSIRYIPCPSNLILADLNINLDSLAKANVPK